VVGGGGVLGVVVGWRGGWVLWGGSGLPFGAGVGWGGGGGDPRVFFSIIICGGGGWQVVFGGWV